MWRKPCNKATSTLQLPLLLLVFSLWPRRTEACRLALITGLSTKSLSSSVTYFPSSQPLWSSKEVQLSLPPEHVKPHLDTWEGWVEDCICDTYWPYGLVNATSVFPDFMHEMFWEYIYCSVLIYIDDILVYSRNLAEHHQYVLLVLERLRK